MIIDFYPNDAKKVNEISDKIITFGKINIDSCFSILNSDLDKTNIIKEWIKQKIKKDQINFELIFRMSGFKIR